MGGRGSGRLFRWDSKRTTAGLRSIDIRKLKKWGSLQPGREGSLSWSRNGERIASIGYRMEEDKMILIYRHRPEGGEWEPIEQTILFDRTTCNYGGQRTWFLCPRCFRRVAVLYKPGKRFFCRHCHDLAYATQHERPPFRLLTKAQKIRELLGASLCTDELIWDKPKGMHWKTFERLKNKADEASEQSWQATTRLWGTLDPFS